MLHLLVAAASYAPGTQVRSQQAQRAQVACGYDHTVLLADGDSPRDSSNKLKQAPTKEAEAGPSGEKGGPPKKKAKK